MSPGWAVSRLRSRAVIKAYEAAIPTRTHKIKRENRNANQLNQIAGKSLREQARWFDNNHDLVVGALDKMEERVIGAKGIIVEPQPLTVAGTLNNALAEQIRARWAEWSVSPDVTGQYTRPVLERLLLRTWLRDGEVFSQMVAGKMPGLEPVAGVPFWLEAMEPDYVPMEQTDSTNNLIQGIYFNDWQRPKSYIVCKSWPGFATAMVATKLIDAENMLHLKFTRRLNQARGVTLLAPVIIRLLDLKEYEDSERLAARISAAFAMFIRRSDAMVQDGDAPDYADKDRDLDIEPGTILKDLQPGELTADAEDNNYLDDENADWKSTTQGQKSAGDTSVTLAWKPGEDVQKKLIQLFTTGQKRGFRIKYPNGTVDVFRGWVSSLGKTVQSKDEIARTVKITSVGRPYMAEEDAPEVVSVTGLTVEPTNATVKVGATTAVTFTVKPDNVTDKSLRIATSDPTTATVTQAENIATVKGVKAGTVKIIGMTTDGNFTAIADITVQA
ncbi:TPA: phage portal protein [Salmonella enterica subsp. enterica serovar Choleraesuis]|nr:phage portal protein [Salmonella enterica]EHD3290650.1 phage portal protein [Salmonella enterica subsp. enterica serovar 6,7,[14]:-:1,5]EEC6253328.1 phage portal protein [Salmonella enterica]EEL3017532.1 phage portal protein [Salmonella enterica]EEP3065995.1 phage portal protein [Salmonella enterica subsp. enterica serovar Choleraesuis]EEY4768134.1 phage portal protein [Salmonella enterica]